MRALALVLLTLLLGMVFCAAAQSVTDDQIYDLVRRRLAGDPDVKGGGLEVDVKDGVVTIKGAVRTEKARSKAEKLARKVKGVKSVVNQIVVKPVGA